MLERSKTKVFYGCPSSRVRVHLPVSMLHALWGDMGGPRRVDVTAEGPQAQGTQGFREGSKHARDPKHISCAILETDTISVLGGFVLT